MMPRDHLVSPTGTKTGTRQKRLLQSAVVFDARPFKYWCREGDLNPHVAFATADFKSAVSADSTIPAMAV